MRTTKLVWVLATAIAVLLGAGMVQYARIGSTTPAGSPTIHLQTASNIPTADPPATVPTGPASSIGARALGSRWPDGSNVRRSGDPDASAGHATGLFAGRGRPGDADICRPTWRQSVGSCCRSPRQPAALVRAVQPEPGPSQPGGGALVNPNLIYPGWTLEFPAGATGLADTSAAGAPSSSGGVAP